MKRIIISILGGILFPILYTVAAGIICEFVLPQYKLDTMLVANEPSIGLIFAPIAIPVWLYNYIHFYNFFGYRYYLDTIIFRTFLFLGFNITLYTFLTYLLLWYFSLFKKTETKTYQDPPLPPQSFN